MNTMKPFLDSALDHGVLVLTVLREQIEGEEMADALRDELTTAVTRHAVSRVVLDLSSTRYISSIIFWPLLSLRRQLLEQDGSLIICGLGGTVQEVFTTTKMVNSAGSPNAPFEVAVDRPQAVARLARLHTAN